MDNRRSFYSIYLFHSIPVHWYMRYTKKYIHSYYIYILRWANIHVVRAKGSNPRNNTIAWFNPKMNVPVIWKKNKSGRMANESLTKRMVCWYLRWKFKKRKTSRSNQASFCRWESDKYEPNILRGRSQLEEYFCKCMNEVVSVTVKSHLYNVYTDSDMFCVAYMYHKPDIWRQQQKPLNWFIFPLPTLKN
jgi:hypothetical protein